MSGDRGDWPLPAFRFQVDFGDGLVAGFAEVGGLDAGTQAIEYRRSDSSVFSTVRMPGIAKYGNVTLKRGLFAGDRQFWDWYERVKMNEIARRPVIIRLLDEAGAPVMTWTLANAWPTKLGAIWARRAMRSRSK